MRSLIDIVYIDNVSNDRAIFCGGFKLKKPLKRGSWVFPRERAAWGSSRS